MILNLQNLAEDVLLRILCFCGISGVLAASQTCRYLSCLAFDKQVWLALLRDLDARLYLDRLPGEPPHHEFSTKDLIELAKRVVHGPQTWSPAHPSGPLVSCQHVLLPNIRTGQSVLSWLNEPKLLQGGRYVLFNNEYILECWNVAENRLMWKHQPQRRYAHVLAFAAEVVDSGRAAVIVMGLRTSGNLGLRKNVVEIARLDFLTETSRILLHTRAPDTDHDNPFIHSRICGNIAALSMHITHEILLFNWKTQSCILLSFTTICDIALFPTHIIAIELSQIPGKCHMHVWAIQSLAEYWSPVDTFEPYDTVLTKDMPTLLSEIIKIPSHHTPRSLHLAAYCSPLREDWSTIWVYIASAHFRCPSPSTHSTICRFCLFLPPTSPPELHLKSFAVVKGDDSLVLRDISYAGHTEIFDTIDRVQRVQALPRMTRNSKDIIDLPDVGDHVHISPYSGALTYATHYAVVVNYYK